MNITMTLLMKVFQKERIAVVYFIIIKIILTIKKAIDKCYKILLNTAFEPRDMCIIWWNNCKYRFLTTLKCRQAQRLMEREKVQDRYGYIDIENMDN